MTTLPELVARLADELHRQHAPTFPVGVGLELHIESVFSRIAAEARAMGQGPQTCVHNWVDARNEVVLSGEVCTKCGSVRAGNATGQGQGQGIAFPAKSEQREPRAVTDNAASPSPAPAADDDVETVRRAIYNSGWYDSRESPNAPTRAHMALERIAARLAQQDETLSELDEVARDHQLDVMRNVMCRLPDVLVEGDWQLWYDAHRNEWLSEPRAFGGWIAQRLGDTLARLAQFEALAERARAMRRLTNGTPGVLDELAALAKGGR